MRSDLPLMPVDEVAGVFQKQDENRIAEIDSRIEEYQDSAIQNWLPQFFAPSTGKMPLVLQSEEALKGLARLLLERHNDPWLRDLLKAGRRSAKIGEAVRLLADSSAKAESSDESVAERKASRALSLFQRFGVGAGEKRAQLVLILVQQYGHQNWPCESMAQAMLRDRALPRYPWIFGQVLLEVSFCASASDKLASQAVSSALKLADTHRFPILTLRATAAESGLYSALGDSRQAWSAAQKGLLTFWRGTYPNLRGYNALIAMDEIRSPQENWFLDAAVLQEAMPLVEGDPRTTMVAVGEAHLGRALMQTRDFEGADRSFRKAELLLKESAPGPQRDVLSTEIELGFAKVDLLRNNPQASLDRLQRIRPLLSTLPDDLLALDFFQTSGIAELHSNRLNDAERDLNSAIRLAEKDLREVDSESDRWKWSHQNETAYRTLAELKLRSDSAQALRDWEWYKGAALRGYNQASTPSSGNPAEFPTVDEKLVAFPGVNGGSALISFLLSPQGYTVWVWDQNGIREKRMQIEGPELTSLVMRMTEECSDPRSDASDLRHQGTILYQKLILPIEPWISGEHHLIVEPDGVLKTLPFGLLVDSRGLYLGDRFSITISPGVVYLNRARHWQPITAASAAVVLGDPKASGWMPLPDAEQEAQAVAASFDHSHLLMSESMSAPSLVSDIAQADIFHFSGHAQFSIESLGLVTGTLGTIDPALFDAVRNGRTEMVVLSACSSSRGRTGFFDDDDSMVRRLMGAHVPEVLASRWTVDSTATTLLMEGFYSKLLVGTPPSEALDSAMHAVRARSEFSHPYYWAGFSVFGKN
ncbi:MAG TPA: CHAT domain-containing protein [Terracidiphilus sp.]